MDAAWLKHDAADLAAQSENPGSWHVVYWPQAGLAIAVEGNPSDPEDWKEALHTSFAAAWMFPLVGYLRKEC